MADGNLGTCSFCIDHVSLSEKASFKECFFESLSLLWIFSAFSLWTNWMSFLPRVQARWYSYKNAPDSSKANILCSHKHPRAKRLWVTELKFSWTLTVLETCTVNNYSLRGDDRSTGAIIRYSIEPSVNMNCNLNSWSALTILSQRTYIIIRVKRNGTIQRGAVTKTLILNTRQWPKYRNKEHQWLCRSSVMRIYSRYIFWDISNCLSYN